MYSHSNEHVNNFKLTSDYTWLYETPSVENVRKVFEIMRTKLGLAVDASPDEFANNNTPNKFTVLMILDKLYSIFKNHALIGKNNYYNNNAYNNLSSHYYNPYRPNSNSYHNPYA